MYTLAYRELRRLHERAYRAQRKGHFEVGGVLVASADDGLELHFLNNHSRRDMHFEFASTDLEAVREEMVLIGKRVVGIFHSHPISCAVPGQSDIEGHKSRELVLVYDVCGREALLWRVIKTRGRLRAVQVPFSIDRNGTSVKSRLHTEKSCPLCAVRCKAPKVL